ncbi:MAG: DUF1249 domain-containing protein [Pseudomonadales bacterium]
MPNLSRDMAACDANYIRIQQLFAQHDETDECRFGLLSDHHHAQVNIQVLERAKYTATLAIELDQLNLGLKWLTWPRFEVRVYHDLATAEVLRVGKARKLRQVYTLPNPDHHQPDEKSQVNHLLGEFLTLCLSHGAAIEPISIS